MHKASAGETVHPESHLLAELKQDFWGVCRAEFTRTVKEGRVGGRKRGEGGRKNLKDGGMGRVNLLRSEGGQVCL